MQRLSLSQKLLGYTPPPAALAPNKSRLEHAQGLAHHTQTQDTVNHTSDITERPCTNPSPNPLAHYDSPSPTPTQITPGLTRYESSPSPCSSPDLLARISTNSHPTTTNRPFSTTIHTFLPSHTNALYQQGPPSRSSTALPFSPSGLTPILVFSPDPRIRPHPPRSPSPDRCLTLTPAKQQSRKKSTTIITTTTTTSTNINSATITSTQPPPPASPTPINESPTPHTTKGLISKASIENMIMRGSGISITPQPTQPTTTESLIPHTSTSTPTPTPPRPASPHQPPPNTPSTFPHTQPPCAWTIIGLPCGPDPPTPSIQHQRDLPVTYTPPSTAQHTSHIDADVLLAKVQMAELKVSHLTETNITTTISTREPKGEPTAERRRRRQSGGLINSTGAFIMLQYQGSETDNNIGPVATQLQARRSLHLTTRASSEATATTTCVQGSGPVQGSDRAATLDMYIGAPPTSKAPSGQPHTGSVGKPPNHHNHHNHHTHPTTHRTGPTWTPLLRPLLPTTPPKLDLSDTQIITNQPSPCSPSTPSPSSTAPGATQALLSSLSTPPTLMVGTPVPPPSPGLGSLSPDAITGRLFRGSIASTLMQSRRAQQTTKTTNNQQPTTNNLYTPNTFNTNISISTPGGQQHVGLMCRVYSGPATTSTNLYGGHGHGAHGAGVVDSRCLLPALTLLELARMET